MARRNIGPRESRSYLKSTRHVADFNTLDDLIAHARDELGATHVVVAGPETKLYFPRGGQHRYEEARVWRKGGYWHAEGPGARTGVQALPREAQPIGGGRGQRAAESAPDQPFTIETLGREPGRRVKWRYWDRANSRSEAESLAQNLWASGDFKGVRVMHGDELVRGWGAYFFHRRDQEISEAQATPRQIQDFKNDYAEGYRDGRGHLPAESTTPGYTAGHRDGSRRNPPNVERSDAGKFETDRDAALRSFLRGQEISETRRPSKNDAYEAGKQYAIEQLQNDYFETWIYDQMVEADQMRKQDPSSVVPMETEADYKRVARAMLQQLEWDVRREPLPDEDPEFSRGFHEELRSDHARDWLSEMISNMNAEIRGIDRNQLPLPGVRTKESRRRPKAKRSARPGKRRPTSRTKRSSRRSTT